MPPHTHADIPDDTFRPTPEQAPTVVEEDLFAARARGDYQGFVQQLAAADLWALTCPESQEDAEKYERFDYRSGGSFAGRWLAVYTVGCIPPYAADEPYEALHLAKELRNADEYGNQTPTFVVNYGTATQTILYADPELALAEDGCDWQSIARQTQAQYLRGRLLTDRRIQLTGRLARGAAAGALLCVSNGEPWNQIATNGVGYGVRLRGLRESWGVTTPEGWYEQQMALLRDHVNWKWTFVLDIRADVLTAQGEEHNTELWYALVEAMARARFGEGRTTTTGFVEGMNWPPETVDEICEELRALLDLILTYEERMRTDGILPADGWVASVDAWQSGRASNMARWGMTTRLCDEEQARPALTNAGDHAAAAYQSWAEFGAGYLLGRCLHFDEGRFGHWYTTVVEQIRLLLSQPDSPWLTVPLHDTDSEDS